jgi:hypothetical protein
LIAIETTTDIFPIARLHPLLDDPTVNCTFDDILAMSDKEFEAYVFHMRESFLKSWDEESIPPRRGWTLGEIDKDFSKLAGFVTGKFWKNDTLTNRRVIHNTHVSTGSAVNAWHASEMYKTRINYTAKDDGRSIYNFFASPELFKRYLPYARRHFLRDSFYMCALTVTGGTALKHRSEVVPATAIQFVELFHVHERKYGEQELLLEAKPVNKETQYSGYNDKMRTETLMALSFDEFSNALSRGWLPLITRRNILPKHENSEHEFHIRIYDKGQRLFPNLFRSFRISMCQYAVNYPPLTAKLLYQTFLQHVKAQAVNVWDPSAGWAGRLIGAMSFNQQLPNGDMQHLNYVGTDPNPAFYKDGTSIYRVIADAYNKVRIESSTGDGSLYKDEEKEHRSHVYQLGSELFHTTPAFKLLKGRGDLVFSSPPYFNREAYSEDENQSYKKYTTYGEWRDHFLRPTLQNAYDFLNHERYMLWNIADLKVGKTYLPLEQDSIAIAKELGFEYKETILMALMNMPGANRVTEDGKATAKNYLKLENGKIMKYEPVHVFWKS